MWQFFQKMKDYMHQKSFLILHSLALKLRYRIVTKNIEIFKNPNADPKGGWLILPSHPSHFDATFIIYALALHNIYVNVWASELIKDLPYIRWSASHTETLQILWVPASNEKISTDDIERVRELTLKTIEDLKNGKNYIIFPTAHTKFLPKNLMKGKSAISDILALYPNVNIAFVRVSGLWGSRFSWAVKREDRFVRLNSLKGHLDKISKDILKMIFLNGIFFIPKRTIELDFETAPSSFPRHGSRVEINKAIESQLNIGWGYGGEPLYRVPDYFWKNQYIDYEYEDLQYTFDLEDVPQEIIDDVLERIYKLAKIHPHEIDLNMSLGRDLGLDSLDMQNLLLDLEKKYGMTGWVPFDLTTVEHLIAIVSKVPIKEMRLKRKFHKTITQEAFLPALWRKISSFW